MNFQDFLINTTTARSGLKPSFNTGETPTQQNFHDLIDGLFLLQDDTVYKDANNGLAITTGTDDKALLFFDHESQDLTWSVEINNGLHIKDKDGQARLSVLGDGKVGVGTTTPGAKLHVHTEANETLIFTTTALDQGTYERFSFYPYYVGAEYNGQGTTLFEAPKVGDVKANIHFSWRGGGEGLFIEGATNNVGIGTADPSEKLNVYNGNVRLDNGFIRFDNTPSVPNGITGYCLVFYRDSTYYNYNTGFGQSSNKDVWFNAHEGSFKYTWAGTDRININLRSDTNAYYVMEVFGKLFTTSGTLNNSDLRLKQNIVPLSQTLEKISGIRGTSFQWRAEEFKEKNFPEGTHLGIVAQELMKVYPELVNEDQDGYLSVNYTGLIPVLTEAVKDLNNKNEALEARVLHLEKLVLNANMEA
ncbi:tail fiber domain-containing protein [uncultured Microscilla sp.]|uniref:tail fiber domain-containing protein n=1 Tax=uncultured Microscilla sp. TaxID=432653 RepID=UPI00262F6C09|nr:tail fiber domain-containing protein [uncultured Microscilla sp.]